MRLSAVRFGSALLLVFSLGVLTGAAQAAPRIYPLPESQWSAEQRALAARFASGGGLTHLAATLLRHPALAEPVLAYERYVSTESTLAPRHRALLALRTAWLTRSPYLWAHQAAVARQAGLTSDELKRIAQGPDASAWDGFEATLLRAVDELHVDSFLSDATWTALNERYDIARVTDAIHSVGHFMLLAGLVNSLRVEIEDHLSDRLPSGIPYTVSAQWTNMRLQGKGARMLPLEREDWTPELHARFADSEPGEHIANVFRTFVHNPSGDRLRGAVSRHIRDGTSLSGLQTELLLMRIGVLCRSEYEWAAHSRIGRRLGMSDADVDRIIAGPEQGGGDPIETALLRATDELYRDSFVSDEIWAELEVALNTRQLLDVLVAVGGYRSASIGINSAGVQLDPNMADFRFPPHLR